MKSVITCAMALTLVTMASQAKAQGCGEGGGQLCGFVWNDIDGDGIQDDDPDLTDGDQSALNGVTVTLYVWVPPDPMYPTGHWDNVSYTETDYGFYSFGGPADPFLTESTR